MERKKEKKKKKTLSFQCTPKANHNHSEWLTKEQNGELCVPMRGFIAMKTSNILIKGNANEKDTSFKFAFLLPFHD